MDNAKSGTFVACVWPPFNSKKEKRKNRRWWWRYTSRSRLLSSCLHRSSSAEPGSISTKSGWVLDDDDDDNRTRLLFKRFYSNVNWTLLCVDVIWKYFVIHARASDFYLFIICTRLVRKNCEQYDDDSRTNVYIFTIITSLTETCTHRGARSRRRHTDYYKRGSMVIHFLSSSEKRKGEEKKKRFAFWHFKYCVKGFVKT